MLSQYNAVDIEAALRAATPSPPFPPASDRPAWAAIRRAIGEEAAADLVARAEAAAQEPIPPLPATLFLEFQRSGRREGYEEPRYRRRRLLTHLALAECLEGRGRFLDALLDVAWAICEESSWALPAHQRTLTDMELPHIDLGAAMTALELAELDLLLGPALDPMLGSRIRHEVSRRCTVPYLTRHDHWWLYNTGLRQVNNWTAVCNAGVVGAAIYLEPDVARLAELIARAARSLDDYLATFDVDGGSSEGPGYWSYGFGYYTILAHLVEQRTGGRVSFLEGDLIRHVARFPLRTILSPGVYVNFQGESVIADLGRGRYTRAYFGPERYQHLVNSSRGHSVPMINGQEQLPGGEHGAVLLEHRADQAVDLLRLELAGAYPAQAGLESLERTVALHREPPRGWVELIDEVRFAAEPGMCESVLTTFGGVDTGPSWLELRGRRGALRVSFDPAVVAPRLEEEKDVDLALGPADVRRVILAFREPRREGTIRLRIEPV